MPVLAQWSSYFCEKVAILCSDGNLFFAIALFGFVTTASLYGLWKYKEGPRYEKSNRIDGKVVIITGCNTGIGKETALEMAKRGARVYMACRNPEKCEEARLEIMKISGNKNVFNRTLDLASLQSVRKFAQQFLEEEGQLHILINNGGIMATPRRLTADGYESQFAVNHLGHFLLTNLLLDRLKSSAPSRIVVVSSWAYAIGRIQKDDINSRRSYNSYRAYGQSKLANILFTRQLAKLLQGSKVTVNCLHPGSVRTELFRYSKTLSVGSAIANVGLRSAKGGAQTSIFLALDPDIENQSGEYYDRMKVSWLLPKARNHAMAEWLWKESEKMVDLKQ